MEKKVNISIKGLHDSGEDKANVVSLIEGKYFLKDEKHYILYEEMDEESGNVSKNRIKIWEDNVELVRKGAFATNLHFEKDKTNYTYYDTMMGKLFLGVATRVLEIVVNENEIKAVIEYDLLMDNEKAADSKVEILATFL